MRPISPILSSPDIGKGTGEHEISTVFDLRPHIRWNRIDLSDVRRKSAE